MVLLIFGDPRTGTPLMTRYPSIAIDLPLKALVWQSTEGGVWPIYNSPESLQQRHGLDTLPFGALGNLLQASDAVIGGAFRTGVIPPEDRGVLVWKKRIPTRNRASQPCSK